MWPQTAPGPVEDYVLRQEPRAKDAWAIISSLAWLLHGADWFRAGLSEEQLAQELRLNSYRTGAVRSLGGDLIDLNNFLSDTGPYAPGRTLPGIVPGIVSGVAPGIVPGPVRRRTGTRVVVRDVADAQRARLLQGMARYVHRSNTAGDAYHAALIKTGLPPALVVRVLKFLELRVDDLTGPLMYCMRCREHWNLAALIDHVSNSRLHIDAVATQS